MRNIACLFLAPLVAATFGSCSKQPGIVLNEGEPVLLQRYIYRNLHPNGTMYEMAMRFEYDEEERPLACIREKDGAVLCSFRYESGKLAEVKQYASAGLLKHRYTSPHTLLVTDNSISVYRIINDAGASDTLFTTFIFENKRLAEQKTRLGSSIPERRNLSIKRYEYNSQGNLYRCVYSSDGSSVTLWRVTACDNRKNLSSMYSPLLCLFAGVNTFSGMGENNATHVEDAWGRKKQFIYEYNNNGYPVAISDRGERYAKQEFFW